MFWSFRLDFGGVLKLWRHPEASKGNHGNPRAPEGDSRTRPSRNTIPFGEPFFLVCRILGCLWGALAQVKKRMPKRYGTRPSKTLKMLFPCTREHSFHFRRATRKWCSFSKFVASLWFPWPYFIEICSVLFACFFWTGFMGAL